MLEELLEAMRRRHRGRRIRRRVGVAAALLLVAAGGAWIVQARQPAWSGHPVAAHMDDRPAVVVVEHGYRTGLVRLIDDDELVQRLADIDRPAGLIRSEGQTWLTGAVVDAEIETADDSEQPL
jgi:hypothetical protein